LVTKVREARLLYKSHSSNSEYDQQDIDAFIQVLLCPPYSFQYFDLWCCW